MTDLLARTAFAAYRGAGTLLLPFVDLLLERRTRRGKEDPLRRGERKGCSSCERPDGPLVWVHAASVGETMSVLPLIDWLAGSDLSVVLTTGTVTSATLAARRLPRGAIHQYVPLDLPLFINRFLDHWQPVAALYVESEIWPTTLGELHRRRIPHALVNARISERSLASWLKVRPIARALFGRFSLVLAQSAEDAARFERIGASDVVMTGNIKFDCKPLGADQTELEALRRLIGARPILLAASTHPGEEALVTEAALKIAKSLPDLLTIIVPRHPDRRTDIMAELEANGCQLAARSRGEIPGPETDIYLADTLGELGLFYRLADVAFVGGSLVPIGGHNPIEAAQLDIAVLHGPHVYNARDIFAALDEGGGARPVRDANELAEQALRLLSTPTLARDSARAGREIVESGRGALEQTRHWLATRLLPDYLPKVGQTTLDDSRSEIQSGDVVERVAG